MWFFEQFKLMSLPRGSCLVPPAATQAKVARVWISVHCSRLGGSHGGCKSVAKGSSKLAKQTNGMKWLALLTRKVIDWATFSRIYRPLVPYAKPQGARRSFWPMHSSTRCPIRLRLETAKLEGMLACMLLGLSQCENGWASQNIRQVAKLIAKGLTWRYRGFPTWTATTQFKIAMALQKEPKANPTTGLTYCSYTP